jgi:hypothetical protein
VAWQICITSALVLCNVLSAESATVQRYPKDAQNTVRVSRSCANNISREHWHSIVSALAMLVTESGQVMYKNRNITDFFRPFAQPRPPKRSRESSDLTDPPASRPDLPSTADYVTANEEAAPPPPSASRTSSLTSLEGDGDGSRHEDHDMSVPDLPIYSASESMVSMGHTSTSSHRVVKDGEVTIMNSDAESDSDISLDDIDVLLAPRRPAPPVQPAPLPERSLPSPAPEPSSRRNGRGGSSTKRVTGERLSALASAGQNSKYSLDALVAQAKKDTGADTKAAEARVLIGKLEERRVEHEAKVEQIKDDVNMNVDLLASIVKNQREESDFDRLMNSIRRQEMLETTKSWSFFQDNKPSTPIRSIQFLSIGKEHMLSSVCRNAEELSTIILNGYMGELAMKGHLPDDLVLFILDASCSDPNEALRSAYLSLITDARAQFQPYLTPGSIGRLLQNLGASREALDVNFPVVSTERMPNRGEKETPDWQYLRSLLKLFINVADVMDLKCRSYTLGLLLRLSLDTAAVADRATSEALEDAIEDIVASFPEESVDTEVCSCHLYSGLVAYSITASQRYECDLCANQAGPAPASDAELHTNHPSTTLSHAS